MKKFKTSEIFKTYEMLMHIKFALTTKKKDKKRLKIRIDMMNNKGYEGYNNEIKNGIKNIQEKNFSEYQVIENNFWKDYIEMDLLAFTVRIFKNEKFLRNHGNELKNILEEGDCLKLKKLLKIKSLYDLNAKEKRKATLALIDSAEKREFERVFSKKGGELSTRVTTTDSNTNKPEEEAKTEKPGMVMSGTLEVLDFFGDLIY